MANINHHSNRHGECLTCGGVLKDLEESWLVVTISFENMIRVDIHIYILALLQYYKALCFLQLFETTGVQLMADSHYDAPTRIQELLEYLHEREVDLETLADSKRNRLEQCVQLRNFEVEARQVKKTN